MKMDPKCEAFLKRVGQRVRELRLERGWTLEETEEKGWPSWRHLQKVEGGKNVTIATIWKICRLFRISPSELFKGL